MGGSLGKVRDCKWKMDRAMKHFYSTAPLKDGFIGGFCLYQNFQINKKESTTSR